MDPARRRRSPVLVAALVLAAACSDGDATGGRAEGGPPATTADPTTTVADADAPAVTSTSPATSSPPPTTTIASRIDVSALLSADPLIGLNVIPPMPRGADLPLPPGMADFDDMFTDDGSARWTAARDRIGVFKLHAWQVRHNLSDEQLTAVLSYLDEHDLALMFETEPLPPPDPSECQHGESFEGPYDLEMAQRIRDLGGTIHLVAIEEPYHFAHKLDTPGACQYSVERVVDEVLDYVEQMRMIFPDVPVGTIEPIWSDPETTSDDMAIWLDTYAERAGEPFAFLHLDPDWSWHAWAEVAAAIEQVADERGVPLGVLYNGGLERDSSGWMQALMEHARILEVEHGVTPQHVMIQSWVDQPLLALPDDDPAALTSGVVRYTGDRSLLDVEIADGAVVATLRTADGEPIPGAVIDLAPQILGDAIGEGVMRGVVPPEATEVELLVRSNAEGAGPAPADVRISRIDYTDGATGPGSVPNADFDAGLDGWGLEGDPVGSVTTGGAERDRWLELVATPEQQIVLNGPRLPAAGGTDYELRVRYGISPESTGSTVVALEFLGHARDVMLLEPPFLPASSATTDADGTARFALDAWEPGRYELRLSTAGDMAHWPVVATASIEL